MRHRTRIKYTKDRCYPVELTQDERYCLSRCAVYLIRHMGSFQSIDSDFFKIVIWVLREKTEELTARLDQFIAHRVLSKLRDYYTDSDQDADDLARFLNRAYQAMRSEGKKGFRKHLISLLGRRSQNLASRKPAPTFKKLKTLGKMFALTDIELELSTFMFIAEAYGKPEAYFRHYLDCFDFEGRKFLINILETNDAALHRASVNLTRYGLLEGGSDTFTLEDDILNYLRRPGNKRLTNQFYVPAMTSRLPLDAHFIPESKREHLLNLLKTPSKTPTHILLHGPPGTGKTSMAQRLGEELGLSTYEIVRDEDNKAASRRAAIIACINMTKTGRGSLIIVDEADNLLNTETPWSFRGETHDKGWLNYLLEIPGVRMIWIANTTGLMSPAVVRRFSFSIGFNPLNRSQRARMWDQVLRRNSIKRYFDSAAIDALATTYQVSAGVADMAVKKAVDSGAKDKASFSTAIRLGLDAYRELLHQGEAPIKEKPVDRQFTLEGLNFRGDLQATLEQLDLFGQYLEHNEEAPTHRMSLLFYGPPGAGKSELARYIGHRLDREIHFKRFSELQSKWLGEGEKNIREAFNRAQGDRAILVLDEVDSFLFSRDQAQRSFEISFTNEFLTAMERYRGILICTTNRLAGLDSAALRRFTHKVELDYLNAEGNRIFYDRLLSGLVATPLTVGQRRRLERIGHLTPGDFKTVYDQKAFYPREKLTAEQLLRGLEEESRLKAISMPKKPIGFESMNE